MPDPTIDTDYSLSGAFLGKLDPAVFQRAGYEGRGAAVSPDAIAQYISGIGAKEMPAELAGERIKTRQMADLASQQIGEKEMSVRAAIAQKEYDVKEKLANERMLANIFGTATRFLTNFLGGGGGGGQPMPPVSDYVSSVPSDIGSSMQTLSAIGANPQYSLDISGMQNPAQAQNQAQNIDTSLFK